MNKQNKKRSVVVRRSADQLKTTQSKTDHARLHAIDDNSIDYSDAPELPDDVWSNAKLVDFSKKAISLRVDADVLEWFKSQEGRYQTLINKVLRHYMNAQCKRHH